MTTAEFEILAHSLRSRLVKEARRIVGDAPEAEDVAQDTLLKLWTLRDSLGQYRSVEALAVLISRRLALNVLRQSHSTERVELHDGTATVPSAEDVLIGRQTGEYIDSVLSKLPDSQQTLIRLRHIEGYDNASIAALLGSSEGAVRTALSRARRSVAKVFGIYAER
ncbi:MAG: sigma-70 family RNA polymerase sigma factor [Muribaculaceae bacterium]|nr:sigma-70 family RNA polymerase sigma factor [Muribaculaceae bacterium]